MPASELQRLWRHLVSSTCVVSLSAGAWGPALAATELGQARGSTETWLAQGRFNRGGGGGYARPARPAARPGLGGGGGAITRPAPGFDRGNRRPTGGWVNNVPSNRPSPRPVPGDLTRPVLRPGPNRPNWNRPGSPSLSRPDGNRPDWNRPGANRPSWDRPGMNRPGVNRPNWNRPDWVINRPININTINVRPGWWGPGWIGARPWRYGWYGGIPPSWGWWSGSSLAWGITSLASAAIIASAINDAVRDNTPAIDVTDSPYQLVFGSVSPTGDHDVTFSFLFEGSAFQASADCKRGLLNNRTPENPEEAQLINAACQVAYASF